MPRKIGIGVIGMGWMGTLHSHSYRQVAERFADCGVEPYLVSCADEVEARAQEARDRLGFQRCTTDWRKVIEDPEVEVVNITSPNYLHLEMAKAGAAAGKHLFCEKPVGRNPSETAAIERAAREAGILSFVGYNYRWAPLVQYAQKLIQNGELGTITHYRGRFFAGYATNPQGVLSWRFQKEMSGFGVIGDILSHAIDMAHLIAGPIQRVVGNVETFIPERPLPVPGVGTHFSVGGDGPKGKVTNEDYVGALVRFANGAQGTLEACRVIKGPQCQLAFEVHGTKGALSWDFERMNELQLLLSNTDSPSAGYSRVVSGPQHPYHARFNPGFGIGLGYEDLKTIEAFQFLTSIAQGKQGVPGFLESLEVAKVQAALEKSWQTGSWQEVKPI
ncbi:MAG: Gfo/Idh/MocA family oxidoreductase [Terriglobia bacterium]